MKFKQNEESEKVEMSNPLEEGFIDLIQFEITKLNLISSAKCYFYKNGLMDYKKFFKTLYKNCEEIKHCLVTFVTENGTELPEFKIPEAIAFSNTKEPFEKLAKMEDVFEEKLLKLIDIAFENKDWKAFHYLLKKLDTIDHICCRALAAVENNANVLALCEQHITEK